jgi:hypothetical protein
MRISIIVLLVLGLATVLHAKDKPCPLGDFPPSDGDFALRQSVAKTTHPFGQPARHEEHCLYSVRISNGYGVLTAINGPHDSRGTTPIKAWIAVSGLTQHHQYTCLLETSEVTGRPETWKIGDVLWFGAEQFDIVDNPSMLSVFEHCIDIADMTKDHPNDSGLRKALAKVPK